MATRAWLTSAPLIRTSLQGHATSYNPAPQASSHSCMCSMCRAVAWSCNRRPAVEIRQLFVVTARAPSFTPCRHQLVRSRAPFVYRPEGAPRVYLTFEGVRESRTIADEHTRVRVALPLSEVSRLRELLAEHLDASQQ